MNVGFHSIAILLIFSSIIIITVGAVVDSDNDGLNNITEIRDGTDPLRPDTSGDGIDDGTSSKYGLDPGERYPKAFVSAFKITQEQYPEYASDFVGSLLRSGPSPGTLTAFEKQQLQYWVDAPPRYRTAIVSNGYFHLDDWDKDGGVQTLPNGTAGPDSTPFEPNDADGDGILRWYFNADGSVYDPVSGDCLGFDTGTDRVGELGGCDGSGGLHDMGARSGQFDVFVEIDYMASWNHLNRPRPHTIKRIERTLTEQGIHTHIIVDERLPHSQRTDNQTDAPELHRERFATWRQGVFVYGLFVHDVVVDQNGIERSVGGYGSERSRGRGFFMVGWKSERELSATMYIDSLADWHEYVTIHELGHLGGLDHPDEPESVMGPPTANGTLQFTDHEREEFRTAFGQMPYYEPITDDKRDGGSENQP